MRDAPLLEWNTATRTMPGEAESGDIALVAAFRDGALAAAVDGLGHGPEAARAAREAIEVLQDTPGDAPVRLMERCHEVLKSSRGVVMTVARFDRRGGTMTWLGVGNVEGRLVRRSEEGVIHRESMLLHAGIVGYRLPPLRPVSVAVHPGDVLILATDGIRGDFADPADLTRSPRDIAERILEEDGRGADDALVVVARYLGRTG